VRESFSKTSHLVTNQSMRGAFEVYNLRKRKPRAITLFDKVMAESARVRRLFKERNRVYRLCSLLGTHTTKDRIIRTKHSEDIQKILASALDRRRRGV
jgi:hypothetical protein